jgi:hypothetical protein
MITLHYRTVNPNYTGAYIFNLYMVHRGYALFAQTTRRIFTYTQRNALTPTSTDVTHIY